MSGVKRLGEVSQEYQIKADEFKAIATAAALAEAAHKSRRAQKALEFKDSGECRSMTEAEARADADGEIAALLRERLVSAAVADSHKQKLQQLREQNANGRSVVASERETDRMHADGYGGGA